MSMTLQTPTTALKSQVMDTGKTFGQKFRIWRESKGISNYKIEKLTGYSRGNLSNIEAGKLDPSDELLDLLEGIPELKPDIIKLRAWKMMDEYGAEVIEFAYKQKFSSNLALEKEIDKRVEEKKARKQK